MAAAVLMVQVAAWRLPGLDDNFPMALADQGKAVIVVFRSPAKLVVLDAEGGKLLAALDTCGDVDDVFVDAKRQRLYVSCGVFPRRRPPCGISLAPLI